MGSTRPRSVTSPVMAMSLRTGAPVSTETMLVTMAMPADGPSLGVAPSGTWTWMSRFSNTVGLMPKSTQRDCTKDRAAWIDSSITSPSFPVVLIRPLPATVTASMVSNSPPTSVQARPVVMPIWSSSSVWPKRKRRTPAYLPTLRWVTDSFLALPWTISLTALRIRPASERSRLRTPASRV